MNPDGAISGVNGPMLGYNQFAYSFNNPVNMDDESGNWPKWVKNTVKWVAKNIVKPVVKEGKNQLSKINRTYSAGYNLSGTPSAVIFNGQIGISVDTKGNIGLQASGGGGFTGGNPGVSATAYYSTTNAPDIYRLNGPYYQVGGSAAALVEGAPLAVGGDVMFIPGDDLETMYIGTTKNLGCGTPGGELHIE